MIHTKPFDYERLGACMSVDRLKIYKRKEAKATNEFNRNSNFDFVKKLLCSLFWILCSKN
jgi:hypothetical protein